MEFKEKRYKMETEKKKQPNEKPIFITSSLYIGQCVL